MNKKFTPKAKVIWEGIPLHIQEKILNNVWCSNCSKGTTIKKFVGKVESGDLLLTGECAKCNCKVVRVVETK